MSEVKAYRHKTIQDNVQQFRELVNDLADLYERKNADYGNSFSKSYEQFGIISCLTRMSDKWNRLVNLATKSKDDVKVKDESIEDTLIDLASYSLMTVLELRNHKDNSNEI